MIRGTLTRFETGPEGTFGNLFFPRFSCVTVELPWRSNVKGRSCLPPGTYVFRIVNSPKHGRCYEMLMDSEAPDRTNVQFHSANFGGDTSSGFKCDLEGCIGPGKAVEMIKGQKGVTSSKATVADLMEYLNGEPFELEIRSADGLCMID